ncbi:transposase [bacterium]|nr:transposase [bacterium]
MADFHHRRSVRLSYWDYSRPGYYFLTICCHQRQCLFGRIVDGEMQLSEYGRVAKEELLKSVEIRRELSFDSLVIMPNHIHIVVVINRRDDGTLGYRREALTRERHSVSSFIASLKSVVTARINTMRSTPGVPVWQRGFHDHIVRSEASLLAIRQYILDNPRQWELDRLHPDAPPDVREEIDRIIELDALTPLL